ncbi:hypothetical protein [Flavobacterium croceum]|uniref:hypothetical protein n=1 Tax=Flavobacterium croceum TaxID=370975 RepID=UPI0024A89DA3|nr:hypothetical protein [Flavobacterium croceum]
MNYDIKIKGNKNENGSIEFDRLSALTKTTKEIATKALMLQLRGYSDIKPEKNIQKALEIRLESLSGSNNSGTCMTLDCDHFYETIKKIQLDFFKPKEQLLEATPMSLVIQSFHSALSDNQNEADIDKPLLKSLLNFKKNFSSDDDIFYLANRGTIPELKLTKEDFKKISLLEDSIPEPTKEIINGKLDEIKVSKGKLGLQTEQGIITIIAKNDNILHAVLKYIGKEITISGLAHYKPNGQLSFMEIYEFSEPTESDTYFSKKPVAIIGEQQLLFQIKQGKGKSSLDALENMMGLMKDDITEEQFNEMLKDSHL